MDGTQRGGKLRTFALGSIVGVAGAIATARRRRPRPRRPNGAPTGLAAFEDAPCFLEIVEQEAQRYRDGGGEIATGRPYRE